MVIVLYILASLTILFAFALSIGVFDYIFHEYNPNINKLKYLGSKVRIIIGLIMFIGICASAFVPYFSSKYDWLPWIMSGAIIVVCTTIIYIFEPNK